MLFMESRHVSYLEILDFSKIRFNLEYTSCVKNFQDYVASQVNLLAPSNEIEIENLVSCLVSKINSDSIIYTLGNGGSHSTADHFSADLNLTLQRTGNSLRSICISSQNSTFTALANDYGYAETLELFLTNFLKADDVVVAFSASGNSENILRALENSLKITKDVYVLTGFKGGKAKAIHGINSIHIKTPLGAYGVVENLQLTICHFVIDQIISIKPK
jgi:D-sedoheptulose 7-phosphate isomerase